jgi:hypothetical protein
VTVCQPVRVLLMLTSVLFPALGMAGLLLMARLETHLGDRWRPDLNRPVTTSHPAPVIVAPAQLGTPGVLSHPPVGAPA